MREIGVTGRQLFGGCLSISSDSSQDALGHQGTVSVSVCLSFLKSVQSRSVPFSERFILNRSRTDCVSLVNEPLWCATAHWHHKEVWVFFWMQKLFINKPLCTPLAKPLSVFEMKFVPFGIKSTRWSRSIKRPLSGGVDYRTVIFVLVGKHHHK